jgi:hypothetical protein
MKKLKIYRHPDCKRCEKIVRLHHQLDWFDRIDDSTQAPNGRPPPRKGEICVQDLGDGRFHEGVHAVRAIFRQVPLYFPLLLLLRIPYFARRADLDARGMAEACDHNDQSHCGQ